MASGANGSSGVPAPAGATPNGVSSYRLYGLVERNLAWQVTDGRILFVIANADIQYSDNPRLGFFDRERSGHASDHVFELQHNFCMLIRQLRRVIHTRERAEDTDREYEEPDEST